jgi:glycosyltransferase involved in cell wall biosynthesis
VTTERHPNASGIFSGGISAVFPCYNDAKTIEQMVLDVRKVLVDHDIAHEIVVTNDGSSDESGEVLDRLASDLPELRVIHHERNRGYGGALISGFGAATKEWIFYTDGDAQYDASELVDLLAVANDRVDIVQGWKISRGDGPWRAVIGRTYHHTVKLLFGLHVRDTDCDFRLFRRSLLDRAPLTRTSGVICVEMMHGFERIGAEFVEVPVHHYPRPHGRSQFLRLPSIARSTVQLGRLWIRLRVLDRRRLSA